MAKIELLDMKFFGHHGCFEEERVVGTNFIVDLWCEGDFTKPAFSDNIKDAVDYCALYEIVKCAMSVRNNLLENLAGKIVIDVNRAFPLLTDVRVRVKKLNPQLGGEVGASCVEMSLSDFYGKSSISHVRV